MAPSGDSCLEQHPAIPFWLSLLEDTTEKERYSSTTDLCDIIVRFNTDDGTLML